MESLKKTIAKIDSVSRELFLETFERVNEAFKGFTNTLFKGGQGTLMLNSETNGIDLYVQPPGKKVIRMEQLSGGEKALISLAFLLSLMDTKPSPFTLMDEIDAPLDDANLLSLLDVVRIISKKDPDDHHHPQPAYHGVVEHDLRHHHGRRRHLQDHFHKTLSPGQSAHRDVCFRESTDAG